MYIHIHFIHQQLCMVVLTSGDIQGKVPVNVILVVFLWNFEEPKSQIFTVKSAAITTENKNPNVMR